jgi:hypothetical protein
MPAIYHEQIAQLWPGVPVEKTQVDALCRLREMIKYWALIDAIATPTSSQAEHLHAPLKSAEQLTLLRAQREPPVYCCPSLSLGWRPKLIDE